MSQPFSCTSLFSFMERVEQCFLCFYVCYSLALVSAGVPAPHWVFCLRGGENKVPSVVGDDRALIFSVIKILHLALGTHFNSSVLFYSPNSTHRKETTPANDQAWTLNL